MIGMQFKVFSDFDGTISIVDVGENLFREFGNKAEVDEIINNLLEDKITARECWVKLCSSINNFSIEKINSFIDSIEIDKSFKEFYQFCCSRNIPLYILSDGFDYYINRILKKENIESVQTFSNYLEINDNEFIPSFPYYDSSCRTSANCKRNHIIDNSGDDEFTVFIGDGNSDIEVVEVCDFIFAKDSLLKFCEKERITYFPFHSFKDVTSKMKYLSEKKNLKKRRQAELKRKEIYMQE